MSIDLEAEMSSEGGAWGMGRSVWSGVAEECSVGGDVAKILMMKPAMGTKTKIKIVSLTLRLT